MRLHHRIARALGLGVYFGTVGSLFAYPIANHLMHDPSWEFTAFGLGLAVVVYCVLGVARHVMERAEDHRVTEL